MKLDNYLTVPEAATKLQVNRQRILRLIYQKKLRADIVDGTWLVSKVDVLKLMESTVEGKL